MLPPLPPAWAKLLPDETQQPYYRALDAFLDREVAGGCEILPARADIFNALALTPPERVKVVILGQDPYPTPGHAHGLCFSVRPDVRPIPRSLRNIYKELQSDLGHPMAAHGNLESWARQGVLLLNPVLTVRASAAFSHQKQGWEHFTDRLIEVVNALPERVVFILWGQAAQKKTPLISQPPHAVIASAHPSPLSATRFFGSHPFSKANVLLAAAGRPAIDWRIPELSSEPQLPLES